MFVLFLCGWKMVRRIYKWAQISSTTNISIIYIYYLFLPFFFLYKGDNIPITGRHGRIDAISIFSVLAETKKNKCQLFHPLCFFS